MSTHGNKAHIILTSFAIALMGCACTAQTTAKKYETSRKTQSADEMRKSFVEKLENRTVALVTVDDEGKLIPYCSGLWLDDNRILTAAHCIKKNLIVFYVSKEDFDNGELLKTAFLTKFSEKDDLALLLTAQGSPRETIKISDVEPWSGLKLHIVGHTSGLWWTYAEGVVASSTKSVIREDKTSSIQVSAPVWMGNSGGGAFDEAGRLVGLCSWLLASGPNIGFFVPADVIKKFLKES